MRQIHINNHYVPEMYLKNWSVDGNTVLMYRLLVSHKDVPRWVNTSIKSTSSLSHLYSRIDKGNVTDEFENWLNNEIENPAKSVIDKIITGQKKLLKNEWTALLKFTAVQLARTPAFYFNNYEKMLNATKTVMEQFERGERVFDKKLRTKKNIKISTNNFYTPIKTGLINENSNDGMVYLEYKTFVGRSTWLSFIERMATDNLHYFEKCKWYIIECADSVEWATSDNPVICKYNNGIVERGAEILFPLSPKHLLYTNVGNNCPVDKMQKNDRISQRILEEILQNSFLCVYSKLRQKNMFQNCPRVENEEDYKHIQKQLSGFHKMNSKLEIEYFNE